MAPCASKNSWLVSNTVLNSDNLSNPTNMACPIECWIGQDAHFFLEEKTTTINVKIKTKVSSHDLYTVYVATCVCQNYKDSGKMSPLELRCKIFLVFHVPISAFAQSTETVANVSIRIVLYNFRCCPRVYFCEWVPANPEVNL